MRSLYCLLPSSLGRLLAWGHRGRVDIVVERLDVHYVNYAIEAFDDVLCDFGVVPCQSRAQSVPML